MGSYLDVDYQSTADFSPATPVTLTTTTLTVANGSLTGTDSFIVNGLFTWTGYAANLGGSGTIDAYGGIAMSNLAAYLDGYTLNNYGTATWTGNGYYLYFYDGSVFNNLAGPSFVVQAVGQFGRRLSLADRQRGVQQAGSLTVSAGAGDVRGRRAVQQHRLGLRLQRHAGPQTAAAPAPGRSPTRRRHDAGVRGQSRPLGCSVTGDTVEFLGSGIDSYPTSYHQPARTRPPVDDPRRRSDRLLHWSGIERGQRPRRGLPGRRPTSARRPR